jgi:hypothetical protein
MIVAACGVHSAQTFTWKDHKDGRLELVENGRTALVYNYGPQLRNAVPADRRRCCYIFPLFTPAGVSVLDDFPKDHWHHRGLFWAWPVVETGGKTFDLWALRGIEDRFERIVELRPGSLILENGWYAGSRRVAKETVALEAAPSRGGIREFGIALRLDAVDAPVTLRGSREAGKSYGGFGARFAPRAGTVLRTDGGAIPRDEDLNRHAWAELEATYGGRRAVLRITPDPADRGTPYQWCLRHYGFAGASFPGRTIDSDGYTLEPAKPLSLKFRVRAADLTPD